MRTPCLHARPPQPTTLLKDACSLNFGLRMQMRQIAALCPFWDPPSRDDNLLQHSMVHLAKTPPFYAWRSKKWLHVAKGSIVKDYLMTAGTADSPHTALQAPR